MRFVSTRQIYVRHGVCRLSATIGVLIAFFPAAVRCNDQPAADRTKSTTIDIPFKSYDGYEMFGKLTLPKTEGAHPVVIYVQTAEAMTVDVKRSKAGGGTFNYFDLYREKLPQMNVGFFSYEGRGVRLGEKPPRFERIDRKIYDTSTLDNKVRDALSAVRIVRGRPDVDGSRIFLMGASEGTLLAAEAAARAPQEIAGLILYGVMSSTMQDMFRHIVTTGGLMEYCRYFDTNKDGKISKAEFQADPYKYRALVFKNADFSVFDRDGDGFVTVADMRQLTKPLLDAVDSENFAILDRWAETAAGVSTPKHWFKDHFAHAAIWTFLAQLDKPVGCFHGTLDAFAPIDGVRQLEQKARAAGKSKMQFHYFDGLDHSLGIGAYFTKGKIPKGHQVFEFVRSQVAK
ncbi:MAG TPA: hypothetical protein VFG04_06350 [Planctomycetaceae bacterium]|jgi:pimeloyl-ACP methyl ester carboxylesterase|nr:hypothetical protein [Planctomycetaceae bacterium]